jgi:hypothetical protein
VGVPVRGDVRIVCNLFYCNCHLAPLLVSID